jgi:hypothetical protein
MLDARRRLRQRAGRHVSAWAGVAGLVTALVACMRRWSRPEVVIDLRVAVTVDRAKPPDRPGHEPTVEGAGSDPPNSADDTRQRHRHARARPLDAPRQPRHLRVVPPPGNSPPGTGNPAPRPGNPRQNVTDLRGRRDRRWPR